MSALGIYEACKTLCRCPKCEKRGNSCSPCMDCTGREYDPKNMEIEENREDGGYRLDCQEFTEIIDKGYPFILTCSKCGKSYEACFCDEPCKNCGDAETKKRWTLKAGFEKEVPNPGDCSIKNFNPEINFSLSL